MVQDEVAAIIDFDAIRISQQARDAAFAIYRFGRQFLFPLRRPTMKSVSKPNS